jgi:hypothetical protein
VAWAVYLLFGLYYAGAVFLARDAAGKLSVNLIQPVTLTYAAIGVVSAYVFVKQMLPSGDKLHRRLVKSRQTQVVTSRNKTVSGSAILSYARKFPNRVHRRRRLTSR